MNGENEKDILQYSLGALLYRPAINKNIAEDICNIKYKNLKSTCICLEDSISDKCVLEAEENVYITLNKINSFLKNNSDFKNKLPLIFIRIRNPLQMKKIYNMIKNDINVLTGFVLPKFDLSNTEEYKKLILNINSEVKTKKIYVMPIIESESVINIKTRYSVLTDINESLKDIKEFVLNIRIGGNDLCNKFGLRRSVYNTIYDIGVIRNIMSDIYNVFGSDYIVSGPVWEYFDSGINTDTNWKKGLINEIKLDILNGFIGKTAIHPSQIDVINESLMVEYSDYIDAKKLLNWNDENSAVEKGIIISRMNEVKVHRNWAYKIMMLSKIFGIKNK